MLFDKRQTNIAKGLAVLFLLWHHLFFNSPDNYSLFYSMFSIKGIPAESFFADFCKVCVAVFLVLSGYGLHKSWERYCARIIRGGIIGWISKINFCLSRIICWNWYLVFGLYTLFLFLWAFGSVRLSGKYIRTINYMEL